MFFCNQESRNASSLEKISQPHSSDVSTSLIQLANLNNSLSISGQISGLDGTNQAAGGKDGADTTDTLSSYFHYNNVGSSNEYKQIKVNSLFKNQVVTHVGYSNYAGHSVLNTNMSDLIIRSTGSHNIAVQNIFNGYNNSLVITQNGSFNEAYQDLSSKNIYESSSNKVLQTGYHNWIKNSHSGQNNTINAVQNGDSNRVSINQSGKNNEATIRQSGSNNAVEINQN